MLALALGAQQLAGADPVDRWSAEIAEASRSFAIPETWIRKVIRAESGGLETVAGKPVVSRAGAMGLMQLMPGTWSDMRSALRLGSNPFDPRDNILAGTFYLRLMYERFGYPGLFAAYNAGPARFEAYLSGRGALPAETAAYVAGLDLAVRWRRSRAPAAAKRERISSSLRPIPGLAVSPEGLFVPLTASPGR